jgi:general secretion pathway protein D
LQLDQLPQQAPRTRVESSIVRGTGTFVGTPRFEPTPTTRGVYGEPVTLDFSSADVRDVVRSVLGDVLKVPYVIDPAAQGNVTLQTGGPIPRDAVLPHLETALRLGGLAIVETSGLYRVVPLGQAAREVQLSQGGQTGFVARVITPRYVPAAELDRLLQPFVPSGTNLRSEPSRNVLIVSGPAPDVTALLDNFSVFDVDTMRGLSTALLPLKAASAKDVAKDVTALLASLGESGQLVRVQPLERVNALLVTSMRPEFIDRVRKWVIGLDKTNDVSERHIIVYRVQNGRAANLASVLRKTFGISGGDSDTPSEGAGDTPGSALDTSRSVAPSNQQVAVSGGGSPNPLLGGLGDSQPPGGNGRSSQQTGGPNAGQPASGIRINADETNNALLILATQQEFATMEAALRQLDIAPLQVMIEATIAEVDLNDQLNYGLQYYVKSGNFQALFAQAPSGSTTTPFSGFPLASGLNIAYGTAAGSNVVLQMLQQITNTRVLSSPNLLVLNNQSARIQVGDQVPVATGSATSTIGSNAPIVNSIDYRDTGVIMKITPRVNASGIVSLDIGEEVSSVSSTTTSSLNSPTISERLLDTTVSVADGQTIALGGLISDSSSRGTNGIPVLQNLPGVGFLFGQKSRSHVRTELIAILTPHVIRNTYDARLITQELQSKLPLTIPSRAQEP